MKENNLQKKPSSAEEYANLFLLDENGKKRDFSKTNSVCFITIGYAETLWTLLQEFAGKDITIIDRKSEIDFIEALKKIHNRDDIKIVQKFEVETEEAILNTIFNKDMSFDLIIANPPYGKIGTQIFQKLKTQCNNCVIGLDQSADIKRDKLFQYISYIKGPFNCFEGASVVVYAFILKKTKVHDKGWDEWSSDTRFDKDWVPFYKRNFTRKEPFTYHCWESEETWTRLFNEKKTFLLTVRTVLDGTHSSDTALDIAWNKNNMCKFTPGERTTGGFSSINKEGLYAAQGYEFKTIEEKENIIHWWYNSKIASYLCWGLKKQSFGRGYLPRINWNKEGMSKEDYTDDYVIKELELKWKDENDPTKGVDFLKENV